MKRPLRNRTMGERGMGQPDPLLDPSPRLRTGNSAEFVKGTVEAGS